MMKKNKIALISAAALMAVAPLAALTNQPNTVQAATNKAVMHTALAYDKDGKSTSVKYNAYQYVTVESNPVKINGSLYYKVSGKDQYLKATNIDGVTRKITHNTYIYRTSTRRTSYNNRWKLYKGETITTYGGSYKFKNGKHYFRVGGPRKQYVKSYNLGPVIKANTVQGPSGNTGTTNTSNNSKPNSSTPTSAEETTVTVDANYSTPIITFDKDGRVVKVKTANPGEKFTVDYLEKGSRANKVASYIGQFGGDQGIYRIKGTNNWLYSMGVKAASKITAHDYDLENYSLVRFPNAADLYNENGISLNAQMKKNHVQWKVDKLVYIWVPSENKAEEFYHLSPFTVGDEINYIQYATHEIGASTSIYDRGAYVKASDVQFMESSVKLTPSNTAAEAQAAAQKK